MVDLRGSQGGTSRGVVPSSPGMKVNLPTTQFLHEPSPRAWLVAVAIVVVQWSVIAWGFSVLR